MARKIVWSHEAAADIEALANYISRDDAGGGIKRNADLHVWREPYVWATSTGATVDADSHGSTK